MQATGSFPLSRIINGPFDPEGKFHNNGCNAKDFLGNGEDSTRRKRRKALPHFTASLPYGGKFTGITSSPKWPDLNDKSTELGETFKKESVSHIKRATIKISMAFLDSKLPSIIYLAGKFNCCITSINPI